MSPYLTFVAKKVGVFLRIIRMGRGLGWVWNRSAAAADKWVFMKVENFRGFEKWVWRLRPFEEERERESIKGGCWCVVKKKKVVLIG